MMRARLFPLLLTALGALAPGCRAQTFDPPEGGGRNSLAPESAGREGGPSAGAPGPYIERGASPDGTGRYYMGREIARYMSHRGAAWLEREDREQTERPDAVVEALGLEPDDVVVDLGAGTGYFTFRMAPLVPRGRVLAVDIQPEMLGIVERRAEAEGVTNVVPVLGTESDPGLPPNTVDLSLLVDSYHEFGYPREVMEGLYRATRPGGRLVMIEYRGEDPSVPIRELHKMTEAQVRREVEAVGFRFVENRRFLPQQHFLVFERPR